MPDSGQTGRKDRASVWCLLLGSQQRKGRVRGHMDVTERQRPEEQNKDPLRGTDRKTEIHREVNGVRDPHKDRSQWRNTETHERQRLAKTGTETHKGSQWRNTDPRVTETCGVTDTVRERYT